MLPPTRKLYCRELMNEAAKLGFHCRELRTFCAWETTARMRNTGSPYRCAYAQGLSGAALQRNGGRPYAGQYVQSYQITVCRSDS